MIDCIDYVITHKECNVDQDDLYKVLCVGGLRIQGMLCELDGENIAEYNTRLNETTGLYWIWKNTKSRFVGLSHYRRFFIADGKRLDAQTIRQILVREKYDMIMAPVRIGCSIYANIRGGSGNQLTVQTHDLFRKAIAEKQPEYVKAFDKVMAGNQMYYCGMFVTRRKLMNEYCKWLFSFLLDVVDQLDLEKCAGYKLRVAGYFCEAFWSVWLENHPELKVFDMPLEVIR